MKNKKIEKKVRLEMMGENNFIAISIDENGKESRSKEHVLESSYLGSVKRQFQSNGYKIEDNTIKKKANNMKILDVCPLCGTKIYEKGTWVYEKGTYYHRTCYDGRRK